MQPHELALNLAAFLRLFDRRRAMAGCPLTSLQPVLVKIGARVLCQAHAATVQPAAVAVTGILVTAIPAAIRRQKSAASMRINSKAVKIE